MAKGKKTGGRDFVKGQVTNPIGRLRVPEEFKAIRKLTMKQVQEIGSLVITGDRDALFNIINNPSGVPIIKLWLAKVCKKGIDTSDPYALDVVLNRLIGKVKEHVEVTLPKPTIINPREGSDHKPMILGAIMKEGEEEKK